MSGRSLPVVATPVAVSSRNIASFQVCCMYCSPRLPPRILFVLANRSDPSNRQRVQCCAARDCSAVHD